MSGRARRLKLLRGRLAPSSSERASVDRDGRAGVWVEGGGAEQTRQRDDCTILLVEETANYSKQIHGGGAIDSGRGSRSDATHSRKSLVRRQS